MSSKSWKERKKSVGQKIAKEILAENVLNIAKDKHRFQKISKPQRINTKKFTTGYIAIKLLKSKIE